MCLGCYSFYGGFTGYSFYRWFVYLYAFTSSSLMASNFALCGIPFLAEFYSIGFILEMFSVRYVKDFVLFFFYCLCPRI